MDLQDAIKLLDYHQRWRQGIEEDMKYKPSQLTEALDIVLEQVKNLNIDNVSKRLEPNYNNPENGFIKLRADDCGNDIG